MAFPIEKISDVNLCSSTATLTDCSQGVLDPSLVFGNQQTTFQAGRNGKYFSLSITLHNLEKYLSGEGSYADLKKRFVAWNERSDLDGVDQAAKKNLVHILESVQDPKIKDRAQSALLALRAATGKISGAVAPVVTMADAAPQPVAPPPVAPRVPVARASGDFTGKKTTVAEYLSDESIFGKQIGEWNKPENKSGKYFVVNSVLTTLRAYVDGKVSEKDLRIRMQSWQKSPCLQEPLSKRVAIFLPLILSMSIQSLEIDSSVKSRASKAAEMLPELPGAKEDKAAPSKPRPEQAAPVPAAVPGKPAANIADTLTDEAIFGSNLSQWNDPSAKSGKYFTLNSMLNYLKGYLRGEKSATYSAMKARLESWTKSDSYKDDLSQQARKQIIAIISSGSQSLPEGEVKQRVGSALFLFTQTKEIGSVAPIAPVVVAASEERRPEAVLPAVAKATEAINSAYEFDLSARPAPVSASSLSDDQLKSAIMSLGRGGANRFAKRTNVACHVKAEAVLEFDSNGFLKKVKFNNVKVQSGINNGEQLREFLSDIAGGWRGIHYRANMKVQIPSSTFATS